MFEHAGFSYFACKQLEGFGRAERALLVGGEPLQRLLPKREEQDRREGGIQRGGAQQTAEDRDRNRVQDFAPRLVGADQQRDERERSEERRVGKAGRTRVAAASCRKR